MTDTPAIGRESVILDSDQARALRAEMVTALVNDGVLTDDRWSDAFQTVPRHLLVPDYYQAGKHIDGATDQEGWLRLVYSDTTLITQRRLGTVTSSGTMPSLLAMMLQALEVEDDHRVLQVGTGTGYTAALLCERVGSAQVISIDVDSDLTTTAQGRLWRCGYTPTVITADGAHGHLDRAPYERIIVTFAVTSIPTAWIDQTRTGGVVVTPVFSGVVPVTQAGWTDLARFGYSAGGGSASSKKRSESLPHASTQPHPHLPHRRRSSPTHERTLRGRRRCLRRGAGWVVAVSTWRADYGVPLTDCLPLCSY